MWLDILCVFSVFMLIANPVSPNPTSKGCQCAIKKVLSEKALFPCPKDCDLLYDPVCGFNPCEGAEQPHRMFRTFHNKCQLENTICDGPGNLYYKMYKGTCVMDHQDETSCIFHPDIII